ncbi:MAG: glycosyltransferase family 2 protein [Acidobacteria bacterium]|nr:glycosyltransferase family 2 protein [Acidobacteriota bacterium]
MKLSIIIPVYNEESTITQVLDKLMSLKLPVESEIIIADDGSTDKTGKLIEDFRKKNVIKVHTSLINLGKGAAVRFGIEYAEGDYIVIQDADLELNPNDLLVLLKPVLDGSTNVVYGSRFKKHETPRPKVPWITILANKVMTTYTNILYGGGISDMATAYKLIRRDIIKSINLRCTGFEFEPEITAKLLRLGHKIKEVPISYQPRTTDEGKKIGWKDGFKYMYYLTKYRFVKKETLKRYK